MGICRPIPGLWRQKPEPWGPRELVQANVRRVSEDVFGHAAPVLCLPLWEKAGSVAYNYSPCGNNALLTGDLFWSNGDSGPALFHPDQADGNGYGVVSAYPEIDFGSNSFSIVARMFVPLNPTANANCHFGIGYYKQDDGYWSIGADRWGEEIRFSARAYPDWDWITQLTSGGDGDTVVSLSADTWYDVACIRRTETSRIEIWINGAKAADVSDGAVGKSVRPNADMCLFAPSDGNSNYAWERGGLSFVAAYNFALTPDQIAAKYDRTHALIARQPLTIYFDIPVPSETINVTVEPGPITASSVLSAAGQAGASVSALCECQVDVAGAGVAGVACDGELFALGSVEGQPDPGIGPVGVIESEGRLAGSPVVGVCMDGAVLSGPVSIEGVPDPGIGPVGLFVSRGELVGNPVVDVCPACDVTAVAVLLGSGEAKRALAGILRIAVGAAMAPEIIVGDGTAPEIRVSDAMAPTIRILID